MDEYGYGTWPPCDHGVVPWWAALQHGLSHTRRVHEREISNRFLDERGFNREATSKFFELPRMAERNIPSCTFVGIVVIERHSATQDLDQGPFDLDRRCCTCDAANTRSRCKSECGRCWSIERILLGYSIGALIWGRQYSTGDGFQVPVWSSVSNSGL